MGNSITDLCCACSAKFDCFPPEGVPLRRFLQGDNSTEHDVHSSKNLQALHISPLTALLTVAPDLSAHLVLLAAYCEPSAELAFMSGMHLQVSSEGTWLDFQVQSKHETQVTCFR